MRNFGGTGWGDHPDDDMRARSARSGGNFTGYDAEYESLGGDYEELPHGAGAERPSEQGLGWPGRRMFPRRDSREWGEYRADAYQRHARPEDAYEVDILRGYEAGPPPAPASWREFERRRDLGSPAHGGGRFARGRGRGLGRLPADYRRYLSREEYGLDAELERPGGGSDGDFSDRARRARRGRDDALSGTAGFRRYDRDYDDYAW